MEKNFLIRIAFSGTSIYTDLTQYEDRDRGGIILGVDSSNGGSIVHCSIGDCKKRIWYLAADDVSIRLADLKRHSYWDFLDLSVKVDFSVSDDSDDLVIEFVFWESGVVSVRYKLFDSELDLENLDRDQFLLDEGIITECRYYGETLFIEFRYPGSDELISITLESDINK